MRKRYFKTGLALMTSPLGVVSASMNEKMFNEVRVKDVSRGCPPSLFNDGHLVVISSPTGTVSVGADIDMVFSAEAMGARKVDQIPSTKSIAPMDIEDAFVDLPALGKMSPTTFKDCVSRLVNRSWYKRQGKPSAQKTKKAEPRRVKQRFAEQNRLNLEAAMAV